MNRKEKIRKFIFILGLIFFVLVFIIPLKFDFPNIPYFFSTIAQVIAALIGLVGIFVIFCIDVIKKQFDDFIEHLRLDILNSIRSLDMVYTNPMDITWNSVTCAYFLERIFDQFNNDISSNEHNIGYCLSEIKRTKNEIKAILDLKNKEDKKEWIRTHTKRIKELFRKNVLIKFKMGVLKQKQEYMKTFDNKKKFVLQYFKLPIILSAITMCGSILILIYSVNTPAYLIYIFFFLSVVSILIILDFVFQIVQLLKNNQE